MSPGQPLCHALKSSHWGTQFHSRRLPLRQLCLQRATTECGLATLHDRLLSDSRPVLVSFALDACRPIFADVFEYLESCQNGVPARELLHRGNSSNPVSSSTLMSSPTAAQAVDQQLYGLKLSADMQLRQMQAQTEKGMAVDQGVPGVAAVMNGADIAWSEVTYGGVPETHLVQPLQDMQQQLGLRLQQQPQQQEWLQDQQLQQAPQQLRQEHAPALRLID